MAERARRLPALCLAIGVGLWSTAAHATRDYEPESDAWNGLRYALSTAREAHVTVELLTVLDWSRLGDDDIVLLLSPTAPARADDLASFHAFIDAGGRAVVADDHRGGASWVGAFGIERASGPGAINDAHADNRAFPRLFPTKEPFLGYNVREIVLNHPAAWTVGRVPDGIRVESRIAFPDPQRLFIAEVTSGSGRVLALSDSSIFINDMTRRFYGDKQLVANVLRYYCTADHCRIRLVLPWATYRGRFAASRRGIGGVREGLRDAIEHVNAGMASLVAGASRPLGRRMLSLGLVLTLLASLLRFARARSPALPRFPPRAREGSSLLRRIAGWLGVRATGNFREPMQLLSEHLDSLVVAAGIAVGMGRGPSETSVALAERGVLPRQTGERLLKLRDAFDEERVMGADHRVSGARFAQLAREVEAVAGPLRALAPRPEGTFEEPGTGAPITHEET